MNGPAAGLRAGGDGEWIWSCACGASGEAKASREQAREEYRQHRRACGAVTSLLEGTSIMSTTAKKNVVPKAPKAKRGAAASTKAGAAKESTPKENTSKKRAPRESSIKAADVQAARQRLEAGTTTLIAESKRLGFSHNGPLRAALREKLGRDGYEQLIAGLKAKKAEAKPANPGNAKPGKKSSTPAKKSSSPAKKSSSPAKKGGGGGKKGGWKYKKENGASITEAPSTPPAEDATTPASESAVATDTTEHVTEAA